MAIPLKNLIDAYEFINLVPFDEAQAFLCKQTGEVYYYSEFGDCADEFSDELPDDIDDGEKYIEFPHKNELNLGKRLVLNFTYECLPEKYHYYVEKIFRKKGAYSRFKHFLEKMDNLQRWYDYESKAQERALIDWCEANEIEICS